MLSKEAIFRQIDADQVEPIQQRIAVDFDNTLQVPLGFRLDGRRYEVAELIGSFRESPDDLSVLFLVRTGQEVYALYQDLIEQQGPFLWRGQWVLHFRVEEEEREEPMLVDLELKQAADFHGHLCPDLAIGYRASRYALDQLAVERLWGDELRAVVENTTSAVDAVQQLTGCTLANRRLRLHDYGRHVYTFLYGKGPGLRLALRSEAALADADFLALEQAIEAGRATLLQTARYQTLLDRRIAALVQLAPEALFDAARVTVEWTVAPFTSALVPCDGCGELIIETHLVAAGGRLLCQPCCDREEGGER
jgi:formylmethanofuran dehydrogenase subunit E